MTEAAPEHNDNPTEPSTETPNPQDGQATTEEKFDKAYVESLRREAAKYRTEAKKATDAAEALRKSQLTEAEKAIEAARGEARTATLKEVGVRLARAQLSEAAAKADVNLSDVLEDLDLTKFVGEDGEPDTKRIGATVDRFKALAGPPKQTSFDGGPRQTAKTTDMNEIIRRQVGVAR